MYADKLRLRQVFDNIFANSYKYADTSITVSTNKDDRFLTVHIADFGGGVRPEELPLILEKHRRGHNAGEKDGAGLGLYISAYFMKEMCGELTLENGNGGLIVHVRIALSGRVKKPLRIA